MAPREDEHARRAVAPGGQIAVPRARPGLQHPRRTRRLVAQRAATEHQPAEHLPRRGGGRPGAQRSEEHTSELQSLMRISYAVFCLKKKKKIYLMIFSFHIYIKHIFSPLINYDLVWIVVV